jgi:hypothetical protein
MSSKYSHRFGVNFVIADMYMRHGKTTYNTHHTTNMVGTKKRKRNGAAGRRGKMYFT